MPKMLTDDGVEIHYHIDDFRDPWITDPGETIVMSHGFSRSMKWWVQWVPALSRKYRVIRYDVRGCGQSSVPPEGATWSADRMGKDVLNVIDHLGIPKIHWVAFESGSIWGVAFAVNHPDRIKSLTVANMPASAATMLRFTGTGGEFSKGVKASDRIQEIGLKQWLIDTNATRLDMQVATPELVEWHTAEHSKTPTEVAVPIMRVVEDLDAFSLLPKIQAPTLILIGDRNPNRPLDDQRAMQKAIPNARLAVFSNIGTGLHMLIPDRCIAEVLRFVGEVDAN